MRVFCLIFPKLQTLAFILGLLFPLISQAQTSELAGYIQDAVSQQPISDAWVYLEGTRWGGRTTAAGRFEIPKVAQGTYNLVVKKLGYARFEQALVLPQDAQTTFLFRIKAKTEMSEEVLVEQSQIIGNESRLAELAGAATLLTPELLDKAQVFQLGEALRKAAGVHVREEEGMGLRPSIGLRGLDPNRSAKVLLLEDGLPLGHAPYGDTDAYYHPPAERFNRIEILKGASQIAYGPMTIGGAINYVTPNPSKSPRLMFRQVVGTKQSLNTQLEASATVGRLGILVDLMRKSGHGARENMHATLYDLNLKAVLRLPSHQSLTFKFNRYDEKSNVPYSGLTQAEYEANPYQNPFQNDWFSGKRTGTTAVYANALNARLLFQVAAYASWFSRDWWRQSSNSDQRPNDAADLACGGMANLSTTCGNEGRLRDYQALGLTPKVQILWGNSNHLHETELGLRVHEEVQNRLQENGDTPMARTGKVVENNKRRNLAYAGYLSQKLNFKKLILTPGLRFEHVYIERTNNLNGATGHTTLAQWIPGLGLAWNRISNITVFGGVHRGFAPPRPSDMIGNADGKALELDPELSWNYEIGLRGTLAKGISVEAAAFRLHYENQIIPANLSGGIGATLTSAGETLHQGTEASFLLDSQAFVKQPFSIGLRVAHTWLPTAKFLGTRFSNIKGFETVSVSGNRLPYAPKHLLNVGFSFQYQAWDALLEAVYTGLQFADDLNTAAPSLNGQRGEIPAYTIWNVTLNRAIQSLKSSAFVSVKNLTDGTYIVDRRRGVMVSMPRLLLAGWKLTI